MTPFALKKGTQKCLSIALAAAFALTLAPATGRCDSHSVLAVLMQVGKPKKPKIDCCPCSPCCQDGVCTGARTMPCCPKPCGGCDTECCNKCEQCENCCKKGCENCEGCGAATHYATPPKPECCAGKNCQAATARQADELSRLCAQQQAAIRTMEAVVRELYQEVVSLRQDVQTLRNQEMPHVGVRHMERAHFGGMPFDGMPRAFISPVTPAGWYTAGEFIYWRATPPAGFDSINPPLPPPVVVHPWGPSGVYIATPPRGVEDRD